MNYKIAKLMARKALLEDRNPVENARIIKKLERKMRAAASEKK